MRTRLVAAAALGAVVAPVFAALPALATPSHPACGAAAHASADLLRVDALNGRALGLASLPGAGLRLASARADITAASSSASARGIDASLAGLPLAAPAPVAARQSPPAHGSAQVHSGAVDLGVARVGTGDLRAVADCPSASGSVALADATVLPGPGDSLLRVPGNVNASATVGLGVSARIGLTDVRLFDGTTGRTAVKVLTEPSLTATGGTRPDVRYSAPVLEVTLPGGQVHRLDSPSEHVDVVVSGNGVGLSGPDRTIAESLPGNPLTAVTGKLPVGAVVLRLSVGTLTRHVSGTTVTAEAAALRVQLLQGDTTVCDIEVGVLGAEAGPAGVVEGSGAGGGGTLPLTGLNVGVLAGIGLLIAIAGRFLLVVSRSRLTRS
jgi:hypothetical protein